MCEALDCFWGINMNWHTLVRQLHNGMMSALPSIKEVSANCCKS